MNAKELVAWIQSIPGWENKTVKFQISNPVTTVGPFTYGKQTSDRVYRSYEDVCLKYGKLSIKDCGNSIEVELIRDMHNAIY